MAANQLFSAQFPDVELVHQIQVRPYNADKTKNMRSLNPEDIDQLITIHGMVVRCSDPIPTLTEGLFKCSVCGNVVASEVSPISIYPSYFVSFRTRSIQSGNSRAQSYCKHLSGETPEPNYTV